MSRALHAADVDRCAGHFHGINIKLVKCGGITPARRMIQRARELEMEVMVGCMTESTVGISAIAQLLPLLDYVDMDGAALLRSDIASGVQGNQRRLPLSARERKWRFLAELKHQPGTMVSRAMVSRPCQRGLAGASERWRAGEGNRTLVFSLGS